MSVAPYHKEELQNLADNLHKHLMRSEYQTWEEYERADAYRAVAIAGIANQTAAYLTYGGDDAWEDMRNLGDETTGALSAKETCSSLKLLIYNTISNEGTHCMPPKYERILEEMISSITTAATGWNAARSAAVGA